MKIKKLINNLLKLLILLNLSTILCSQNSGFQDIGLDIDFPPLDIEIQASNFMIDTEVYCDQPDDLLQWECEICNKRFDRKSALIRDIISHSNDNLLHCIICEKDLSGWKDKALYAHISNHLVERSIKEVVKRAKKVFECKECGDILHNGSNLKRHMRRHTGEKPYKCDYCEMRFIGSSNCKKHIRTRHSDKKSS